VAVHDGLDGEFTLLDFNAAQSIADIEAQDGALYVQDPDRVQTYDLASKRMREAATRALDNRAETVEQALTVRLDHLAA
jgi:hypothetical protein